MRRILPALLVLVAVACSSGGKPSSASSASGSSSSLSPASSLTTTVTLDPAVQSAADAQGARAVITLYATRLLKADPDHVTQAMVDCLPDALISSVGAHDLLVLFNGTTFDQLSSADRTAAIASFRGCGFVDETLRRIGLVT